MFTEEKITEHDKSVGVKADYLPHLALAALHTKMLTPAKEFRQELTAGDFLYAFGNWRESLAVLNGCAAPFGQQFYITTHVAGPRAPQQAFLVLGELEADHADH